MISKTAVWQFDTRRCRPVWRSHTSVGGPTIPLNRPNTNTGKSWSWSGSSPHPTRMHNYAGLTSGQKAAWKALADLLNNDHATSGPLPYSGAICYMLVNLYRRLDGQAYDDNAPSSAQPGAGLTGNIQVVSTTPRNFAAILTH